MITELRIGQAFHTPDNRTLYPVYFKTEFSRTATVYVAEADKRNLMKDMEKLWNECKRKKQ